MRPDSFRFSPPAAEPPPELGWVLRRAFAPSRAPLRPPADAAAARRLAAALGLSARIGHGLRREEAAAGAESLRPLLESSRLAAAGTLALRELARRVTAAARGLEMPLLLLKGVALIESGRVPAGRREIADLDVLAPAGRARELATALVETGLRRASVHESSQHLRALVHPTLGAVEIHLFVRGLAVGGARRLSAEAALEHRLCAEAPRLPGAYLPSDAFLAAHALVHGVAQHGYSPAAYPMLRMVADLVDLAERGGPERLLRGARPLVRTVSARELRAVAALCAALSSGEPDPPGDAGKLLRHALSGSLDGGYRRALKRSAVLAALRRGDWKKALGRLRSGFAARRRAAR